MQLGNLCVPYTSIYESSALFVREVSWLADVLLFHESSPIIMTQEGLDGPEKVRIMDVNLCE